MTCSASSPSSPSARTKCAPGPSAAAPRRGSGRRDPYRPAEGFIRAEVVAYEDLIDLGGLAEAKAKGKLRLEGKEYIVKDGEIVHIRSMCEAAPISPDLRPMTSTGANMTYTPFPLEPGRPVPRSTAARDGSRFQGAGSAGRQLRETAPAAQAADMPAAASWRSSSDSEAIHPPGEQLYCLCRAGLRRRHPGPGRPGSAGAHPAVHGRAGEPHPVLQPVVEGPGRRERRAPDGRLRRLPLLAGRDAPLQAAHPQRAGREDHQHQGCHRRRAP